MKEEDCVVLMLLLYFNSAQKAIKILIFNFAAFSLWSLFFEIKGKLEKKAMWLTGADELQKQSLRNYINPIVYKRASYAAQINIFTRVGHFRHF